MKRLKSKNPLDVLTEGDFAKLRQLEECPDLDFLKAVKILGLDPAKDFRFKDLSGIRFDGMNVSEFDFSGAKLAGCSFENAVLNINATKILDQSGELVSFKQREATTSIALNPSTEQVLLGRKGGEIELFSLPHKDQVPSSIQRFDIAYWRGDPRRVGFLSEDWIYAIFEDGSIQQWHTGSKEPLENIESVGPMITDIATTSSGKIWAGWDETEHTVVCGPSPDELSAYAGHTDQINMVRISSSGEKLISASCDGSSCIWSVKTRLELCRLHLSNQVVSDAILDETELFALTICVDGSAQLWSVETGSKIYDLSKGKDDPSKGNRDFSGGSFFLDDQIVMYDKSNLVTFWDKASGNILSQHSARFPISCFDVSGNNLVFGGDRENFLSLSQFDLGSGLIN